MLQFIKKYFKIGTSNKINLKKDLSLKSELDTSAKTAKQEYQKIHHIKMQIYNAAADIIHEIFDVPSEYWYEELKNYEIIKSEPRNSAISSSLVKKCDEVVEAYTKELEVANKKLAFYESLEEEYKKIRADLNRSLKKISGVREDSEQMHILNQHINDIKNIQNEQFATGKIYLNEEQLKLIKEELDKAKEEMQIKKQVNQEMLPFIADSPSQGRTDSKILTDEIDDLIKKLKQNQ
ncbi:MAG: hypothetical protein U9N85_03050 [Bacteroidota bacterium]|nr:hypothetical protein [Bacteroidota bacterium]